MSRIITYRVANTPPCSHEVKEANCFQRRRVEYEHPTLRRERIEGGSKTRTQDVVGKTRTMRGWPRKLVCFIGNSRRVGDQNSIVSTCPPWTHQLLASRGIPLPALFPKRARAQTHLGQTSLMLSSFGIHGVSGCIRCQKVGFMA